MGNKYILTFLLSFLLPFTICATHIVGGALTYTYNGSNSYTVSLTLYRDCGGAAYPASVTIQVQQANGTEFAPSRDIINIPGGAITNVPYSLDSCAEAPSPIPCVQIRTYTTTVTLPPVNGGYHLYYQLCCRNISLSNINTAAQTNPGDGESFYAFIPGTSIWYEDFTLADGTTSDAGATAWTRTLGTTPPGYAQVLTNRFETQGANNAQATWTSQIINISSAPGGANISMDLAEAGTLDANDSIFVYYSLDGGPLTLFATNGFRTDDYTAVIASQNGLIGNTVQIFVRVHYDGSSPTSELYRFDNVLVYNSVSNNTAVFNLFPPLFLCAGNFFTFDHSATDVDGDSLFYSFYTPYRDLPPTFPGNVATFTPFNWNAGYSANSPLNSGGPALTLDPATGLLSGTPNSIGQFQVGIVVSEYRDGILINDMARDFQFNIINCPPPAQALITPSGTLSVCSGNSLTFPNNSDPAATNWTWDFGDLSTTTDVSTLQYPSYTYPGPGSYTARLIINEGTSCADTSTAVVTVTVPPAAPTAASNTPVCEGSSLNLTASVIAGATYTWTGPNSFSSALQNPSIAGVTAAAAGTYSVTATISGCTGPAGTTAVIINPIPVAPTAGSNSPVCAGAPLNLTASAIAGASYSWTGPNSFSSALQNPSIASPTAAAAGTYSVVATVGGCPGPAGTTSVIVNPAPVAPTAGSNSPVCAGSPLNLTASAIAGASYAWTGPNSFSSALQNPSIAVPTIAAAGTYTVIATVAGCPGPMGTTTVVVNSIPSAPTASGATICSGSTATLTATAPGGTYEWYNAASGGTLLASGGSYTTPSLSATTTYYVQTTVSGCTGARTAVTVTVNPIPAAPTAPGTSICTGTSTTLTATAPGGTYQWYDASSGGTLLVTNASYTTPVLAATTTYYVQTTVAGCAGPRTAVTVTVSPVPAAPTAAGTTICTGTSTTLTATAPGGTYQWYNAASGGTLLITNASYTTPVLAATTTYYVQTTVAGCAGPRTAVTVTVSPVPAAPTAAGATICSGSTATLTATAPGGTYEWYDAASGGILLITNASYTSPALSASTTYFVQTTVAGCTGPRTAVTVTVNPIPAAPTAGGTTICQGATATLTATAPGGSYQWYDAASGGTLLITNASYTTPALVANTTYYVQTTISGCTGPRTAVTVTVTPTPAAPTAAGVTICEGTTATLSATAPGGTYQWYDAASGGTLLATASSYTTPVLIANTTYYVQTTVSGCPGPRTAVVVTVTPTPPAPTAASTAICSGSTATLTATAPGGTYEWYSAASGGSLLITNASYTTPALTVSTTYYVQTTISGCVGPRTAVVVTVNPIPAAPTAANATICDGSTATLTATAPGGTYQWYDAASGGTLLITNASYTTPALTTTTTFYVQTTIAGCTGARTAVTVVVNPIPSAPTASGTTICQGSTATLSATAPGGTYRWYPVPTGGTILFTGANYTTPALSATTTYYVQTTVSGCISPRTAVTVTVTPTPVAPTAAGTTICEGNSTTLTATAPGGTYDWYDAASGGTLLVTNASYTTPVLVATTTYYVQTTIAGCTGPRTAVTVTITPTDDPSFNYSSGTYCITGTNPTPVISGGSSGTFSASPAGLVFTNTTTGTINLSASALNTYSITFTTNGTCPSSSSVNITVTNAPNAVFSYNTPYCQNDANAFPTFAAGASAGIFSALPAGLTFVNINTGEVDLSGSTPGTYTVTNNIAAAGGCASATANSTITIDLSPQVNAGANQTICESTTITMNGTIGGSAASATWSGGSGSFSSTVSLTAVYTPGAGETTAQLILTTNDPAGPCSAISDTVIITITPTPAAPTASGTTICEGTTATLTATAPGGTYQWYDAASGGTLLATASSYTTPVLSVSTTYYVQTIVSGCAGPRTAVTITVTPTPSAPTAAGASVCVGSSATITATAPGGTYEWYDAATGGTLLMTNASYTTPALSATTTYYVQTTISGCTGPRTAVTVTVNPIPAAPTAANITICDGSTGTVAATAPGGTYEWYDAASGGTLLSTGASYTTPALSTTTTYYVQSTIAGCTGPRTAVTVNVNPVPVAPTASGTTICQGTTATLSATAPGGTYRWYPLPTGGAVLFTGANYTTPVLNVSTTYYVQTTIGGCTGPRTAVTVTVTPSPAAPTAAGTTICSGNATTLTATAPGGTYEWYDAATGGSLLVTNASYTTPVLTSTTTYYVQTTIAGCAGPRTAVTVNVTPIDDPSFSYSSGTYCFTGTNPVPLITGASGTFSASPAGLVFVNTTTGEINALASTLNTYSVTYTTSGSCSSSSTVNITITDAPSAAFTYTTPYCQNGANLFPSFGVGSSAGIFSASPAGLTFVNTATGEINIGLSLPGTYTITNDIAAAGGCAAATASFTFTIDPSATVNAGPDRLICGAGTTSLAGSIGGMATSATWSGGTGTFSNSSSLTPVYTPGAGETSAMLILTTNDPAGPCVAVSDTMIVTINPIPAAPTAAGTAICEGTTAALTATAPGGTYQWYSAPTGGTALTTGANFTTPVLSSTTTYYVQTSIGGCTGPRNGVTVVVTPTENSTFTYASGTFCVSGTNPSPTVPAGVTGTFSATPAGLVFINASTGEINLAASTLNTYSITFTTDGTCPGSSSINVTITTAPDASFSYNGPFCPGGTNPSPLFPVGASAGIFSALPAGLNFVNPSTGEINLSTSVSGTYTITNDIAASGGCASATSSSTVIIDIAPAVNAGLSQTVCDGAMVTLAGSIGGSASTGTWSGGAGTFSSNIDLNAVYTSVSGEGIIILTLTTDDPAGTCGAVSDTMTITFQSDTSAFSYSSAAYCLTASNPVPLITGGFTGTFSSSPAGLVFVDINTGEINIAASALNTYSVTFTSSGICPNSTSVNLTITNGLDASFSYSGPYCQSGVNPMPLLGLGASAGVFSASPAGLNFVNTSTGEIDLLNTAPGTYNIINFIASSGGCAAVSANDTVTIEPAATVNAGADQAVCTGSAVTLAGNFGGAASTVTWSGGLGSFSNNTDPNAVYTPAAGETSAMLILTSNDPAGLCGSTSDSITITINSIPVAPVISDTTICAGEMVTLTATAPGGTYEWYDAASGGTLLDTGASYTTPVLTATTVYYVETTISGCTGPQTIVTVTVTPSPVINAGTDMTVCGSTIMLSGTADTIAAGAFWTTNGTGTFSPNDSSLTATYTFGITDADTLVFVLTSYGNGLCNAVTDTVMIFQNVQPSAGFSTTNMCAGQAVSFNDSSNANGGTITGWSWSFGSGGGTSVLQNPTFTYPSEGPYSVTLVVSSGTGCNDSITQMITVVPAPVASYTFAANCQNDPVTFTDASSISSGSILTWSWDFADGSSSSNQHPSNTFDSSAVYNVVLTVTSDLGCSASSTQAVSINPSPEAGFTSALNCGSLSVNFTDTSAISSGSISNYNWTFGEGGTSSSQNPSYDYSIAGTYTVTLIVTSNNGCVDTASASIEPGVPVTAAYVPNGGSYNVNESINFDNQSTGATSFLWNFNDGSAASVVTDPSHGFSQPGTYSVMLVAVNSGGCSDTVSYNFVVTSAGTAVPTGFTPNNDGLNDYFFVIGNFSDYELRVFNEWGNQIFISDDQSIKWDGTYQGKEQPAGTYIYIFNGKVIDGEELKMNGEVNLIR
jgi:gliding motility-associated-like protein